MRVLLSIVSLVSVIASPFAGTCSAESAAPEAIVVLFDNGPMNHTNGLGVTSAENADDFELPFLADLTSATISIMGSDATSFPENWDGLVKWFIYTDDGGLPGTLLMSGTGRDTSYTLESTDPPYEFYWLSFNLNRRVSLMVGVRYWFAINLNRSLTTTSGISWAASTDLNYSPGAFNNPYGSGVYEPWVLDFSFILSSSTEVTYIFADGFETANLQFWSSSQP
jgi:hypothetical protein